MTRRHTSLATATALATAVLTAPLVSTAASAAPVPTSPTQANTAAAAAAPSATTPKQTHTGVIAYGAKNALYVTTAAEGHKPRKVTAEPTGDYIEDVHLSADGSRILYTAIQMEDKDNIASRQDVVVDRADGKQVYRSGTYKGSDKFYDHPGLSPDGKQILVEGTDKKAIWFYDIATKKDSGKQPLEGDEWPLGVAPDGRVYVAHGADVVAVDTATGKRTTVLDRDEKKDVGNPVDIGADGSITYRSVEACSAPITSHVKDVKKGTTRTFGHTATDDGITSPNGTQILLTRADKARTLPCFGGDGAPAQEKVIVADLDGDNGRTLFTAGSYDWAPVN